MSRPEQPFTKPADSSVDRLPTSSTASLMATRRGRRRTTAARTSRCAARRGRPGGMRSSVQSSA
jgi:hypothetical protein